MIELSVGYGLTAFGKPLPQIPWNYLKSQPIHNGDKNSDVRKGSYQNKFHKNLDPALKTHRIIHVWECFIRNLLPRNFSSLTKALSFQLVRRLRGQIHLTQRLPPILHSAFKQSTLGHYATNHSTMLTHNPLLIRHQSALHTTPRTSE